VVCDSAIFVLVVEFRNPIHAMVPCSVTAPSSSLVAAIFPRHTSFSRPSSLPLRFPCASPVNSLSNGSSAQFNPQLFSPNDPPQPRTLFPGGYKRPELKVPTLVLQLDSDEVLAADNHAFALIDKAVSKWVGIVLLSSKEPSGGKLYEAACSLKSLLQNRAYLLVAERVDIAAAAAASGVLLSDQGFFNSLLPPEISVQRLFKDFYLEK